MTVSTYVGHAQLEADIEIIQGIGAFYGEKLRAVNIAWVKDLLEMGLSSDGRKLISEVTLNFADLLEASSCAGESSGEAEGDAVVAAVQS